MIAIAKPGSSPIRESKINHKSSVLHPLVRFVTEETVALIFDIQEEDIYRIDCMRHMVYVHGKGVSRFVSYADFPPILGVAPPTLPDFARWHKRWRKRWLSHKAPEFWTKFYKYQFQKASTLVQMREWGLLVRLLKSSLSETALQELRETYNREKYNGANFLAMRSRRITRKKQRSLSM